MGTWGAMTFAILPQFEEHLALLSQKPLPIAIWHVWGHSSRLGMLSSQEAKAWLHELISQK
jgi:hypothetical protein